MISFDKFLEFAKDHDVFPKVVPKSVIFTIFQSLAMLNETLKVQNSPIKSERMNVSPLRKEREQEILGTLDRNLFIEAITLCALYHNPNDKAF